MKAPFGTVYDSVAKWLGHWTCDQLVAGSNAIASPLWSATLGKFLTHMCLRHQAV